jgi:hypothetical protein
LSRSGWIPEKAFENTEVDLPCWMYRTVCQGPAWGRFFDCKEMEITCRCGELFRFTNIGIKDTGELRTPIRHGCGAEIIGLDGYKPPEDWTKQLLAEASS